MRFQRIALIGSVLPRDYDWSMRVRDGQVRENPGIIGRRSIGRWGSCAAVFAPCR